MIWAAVVAYAAAMTAANMLVLALGPWVTPLNAFVLIGLDLALRDWLHMRLSRVEMLALVAGSGVATYVLAPQAEQIAIASAVAFTAAALVDWTVFATARGTWIARSMKSNVAGAAVDSMLFPTIAFGAVMPLVMAGQFAGKVAGGACWTWLLSRVSPALRERSA